MRLLGLVPQCFPRKRAAEGSSRGQVRLKENQQYKPIKLIPVKKEEEDDDPAEEQRRRRTKRPEKVDVPPDSRAKGKPDAVHVYIFEKREWITIYLEDTKKDPRRLTIGQIMKRVLERIKMKGLVFRLSVIEFHT